MFKNITKAIIAILVIFAITVANGSFVESINYSFGVVDNTAETYFCEGPESAKAPNRKERRNPLLTSFNKKLIGYFSLVSILLFIFIIIPLVVTEPPSGLVLASITLVGTTPNRYVEYKGTTYLFVGLTKKGLAQLQHLDGRPKQGHPKVENLKPTVVGGKEGLMMCPLCGHKMNSNSMGATCECGFHVLKTPSNNEIYSDLVVGYYEVQHDPDTGASLGPHRPNFKQEVKGKYIFLPHTDGKSYTILDYGYFNAHFKYESSNVAKTLKRIRRITDPQKTLRVYDYKGHDVVSNGVVHKVTIAGTLVRIFVSSEYADNIDPVDGVSFVSSRFYHLVTGEDSRKNIPGSSYELTVMFGSEYHKGHAVKVSIDTNLPHGSDVVLYDPKSEFTLKDDGKCLIQIGNFQGMKSAKLNIQDIFVYLRSGEGIDYVRALSMRAIRKIYDSISYDLIPSVLDDDMKEIPSLGAIMKLKDELGLPDLPAIASILGKQIIDSVENITGSTTKNPSIPTDGITGYLKVIPDQVLGCGDNWNGFSEKFHKLFGDDVFPMVVEPQAFKNAGGDIAKGYVKGVSRRTPTSQGEALKVVLLCEGMSVREDVFVCGELIVPTIETTGHVSLETTRLQSSIFTPMEDIGKMMEIAGDGDQDDAFGVFTDGDLIDLMDLSPKPSAKLEGVSPFPFSDEIREFSREYGELMEDIGPRWSIGLFCSSYYKAAIVLGDDELRKINDEFLYSMEKLVSISASEVLDLSVSGYVDATVDGITTLSSLIDGVRVQNRGTSLQKYSVLPIMYTYAGMPTYGTSDIERSKYQYMVTTMTKINNGRCWQAQNWLYSGLSYENWLLTLDYFKRSILSTCVPVVKGTPYVDHVSQLFFDIAAERQAVENKVIRTIYSYKWRMIDTSSIIKESLACSAPMLMGRDLDKARDRSTYNRLKTLDVFNGVKVGKDDLLYVITPDGVYNLSKDRNNQGYGIPAQVIGDHRADLYPVHHTVLVKYNKVTGDRKYLGYFDGDIGGQIREFFMAIHKMPVSSRPMTDHGRIGGLVEHFSFKTFDMVVYLKKLFVEALSRYTEKGEGFDTNVIVDLHEKFEYKYKYSVSLRGPVVDDDAIESLIEKKSLLEDGNYEVVVEQLLKEAILDSILDRKVTNLLDLDVPIELGGFEPKVSDIKGDKTKSGRFAYSTRVPGVGLCKDPALMTKEYNDLVRLVDENVMFLPYRNKAAGLLMQLAAAYKGALKVSESHDEAWQKVYDSLMVDYTMEGATKQWYQLLVTYAVDSDDPLGALVSWEESGSDDKTFKYISPEKAWDMLLENNSNK